MNKIVLCLLAAGWSCAEPLPGNSADAGGATDGPSSRNPLTQPFTSTSIWNMPIGSAAEYVPATIAPITQSVGSTLLADQDIIILTPTAPSTPIYFNSAGWQPTVSRCPYDAGALLFDVPVPSSFVFGDTPVSNTPNASLAALLADGRTLRQTQPFARCTPGAPATSKNVFPDADLYGDGIQGAHGGSGLSSLGGTLRVGELRPGIPPPRHAIKLELWGEANYYNDGVAADCYRWPATHCDGPIDEVLGPLDGGPNPGKFYGGHNPAVRPGSLLAIPTSVSIASLSLHTEPAKSLAWTLQNYGAYLVDDSGWPTYNICVELGPAGSFVDQFVSDWGFSFNTDGTTSPFAKDIAILISALKVVNNNAPSSIGGGGTPRQPLAPPLPPVSPADD
jgi:hypothetical protein